MKIRAKMKCSDVAQVGNYQTVAFSAVTQGDENKTWAAHTPSARMEMCITNPNAIGAFEVDREYFLDITPVEPTKEPKK